MFEKCRYAIDDVYSSHAVIVVEPALRANSADVIDFRHFKMNVLAGSDTNISFDAKLLASDDVVVDVHNNAVCPKVRVFRPFAIFVSNPDIIVWPFAVRAAEARARSAAPGACLTCSLKAVNAAIC